MSGFANQTLKAPGIIEVAFINEPLDVLRRTPHQVFVQCEMLAGDLKEAQTPAKVPAPLILGCIPLEDNSVLGDIQLDPLLSVTEQRTTDLLIQAVTDSELVLDLTCRYRPPFLIQEPN